VFHPYRCLSNLVLDIKDKPNNPNNPNGFNNPAVFPVAWQLVNDTYRKPEYIIMGYLGCVGLLG